MFNQVIGKRIRQLREEKNMTREEFAAKAEISSKFLYEIENGKKGLSANSLLKIAKALSCSCDYILSGAYREDEHSTEEQMYIDLLKGFTDRQRKVINEVLKMILEINKETK